MTMEFGSLEALAMHLTSSTVSELSNVKHGLKASAELLERAAKSEIGHYQNAVGPFPAWDELAESTEADKRRHGYPENAPLLRTGAMKESIQHEIGDWEAVVGSTDPKMEFHEFGTPKMPPRPVMGTALYQNLSRIQRLIGNAAVSGFVGGDPIHPSLGYEIEGSADT